jgi:hypothetical protein
MPILALAFLTMPLIAAAAIVAWRPMRRRRHWLWAILGVIVLEAIVFGFALVDQPTQSIAGALALIVALLWVAVGLWLSLTPLPEDAWVAAIGLPIVYTLFLAVGIYAGLVTGVVGK